MHIYIPYIYVYIYIYIYYIYTLYIYIYIYSVYIYHILLDKISLVTFLELWNSLSQRTPLGICFPGL